MTVLSSQVRDPRQDAMDDESRSASVLAYLRAVVAASECLMAEADFQNAVNSALEALRRHTRLDRAYVFADVPGAEGFRLFGESHGPHIPEMRSIYPQFLPDAAFPEVVVPLRAGLTYQSIHSQRTGENANMNDLAGALSDLMVPIMVEGRLWGVVGFDDCKSERTWSSAEIAALQGAASAVAAAVLRDAATRAQMENASALAMRNRLLAAVAESMQTLLGGENRSFDDAVRATLGALGEACGIHRVKVILQRAAPENGEPTHFLDYEWWAPGFASQTSLGLTRFPNSLIPEWTSVLERGGALWYLIDDVPIQLRAAFKSVGVLSVGTVPIFGAGHYLGLIAFDDCVGKRIWSGAEIDALTAAARTIGGAIHQHRLQQAMLEERDRRIELKRQRAEDAEAANAQLRRRDALLDAVARMSRELLQAGDWVPALLPALQRLGEAAGIERVVLLREHREAQGGAEHRVFMEWCAQGFATHGELDIRVIPNTAAAALVAALHAGQAVWSPASEIQGSMTDLQQRLGVLSSGHVPIFVAGDYWGALKFDDCSKARAWDTAEVDSLSAAANAVAAAIARQEAENARVSTERARADSLREANDELIASMSRLVALKDLPEFMAQLLRALTRTCRAQSGSLLAFDGVDGRLWMRQCVLGGELADVRTDPRLALWRQPVPDVAVAEWRMHLEGQVLAYHPVPTSEEGSAWPENLRWHWEMGHRLRLHFPLNIGGQLVGIAGLLLESDDQLDEFQLQQAVVLAQQAAIAMQMERLARAVESSAVRTERERMAAEIHDNLAQSFTSIAMQSESLAGLLANDQDKSRVLRLIERTAREGLAEARMSVLALLPAEGWPGSLDQSLTALAERSSIRGGVECRFQSQGTPCAMPGPVQESLLRIAQEATSNAMRHSGGTQVVIRLDYDRPRLRLTIDDDGRGLPGADRTRLNGGFGVSGMEARATAIGATLTLQRSSLGGLSVQVDAPCHGSGGLD